MRELAVAWLHLAVLWAFALAKPLFDVLADSPEFFVARGNTRGDILLFAITMVVVPPTLLALAELACVRLPRIRRGLHLVFVAGLVGAFAIQVLNDGIGGSSELLVVLAGLLGAAGAFAYARVRAVPSILTVLSPAPLVFLLLFLFASDVSKLILPQDSGAAAQVDVRGDTPVVMVIFDEFDPNMLMDARERIDRSRYPNFAAFADDAIWYRNATTVNGQTTLAVPGLLSGVHPSAEQLPIAADHPNTLFTLLGRSYEMDVTETATELCPERLCGDRVRPPTGRRLRSLAKDLGVVSLHLLAPDGLRSRLPAVDRTFEDFGGGGRDETQAGGDTGSPAGQPNVPASTFRNRARTWDALLDGIGQDRGPALHFLHAALPHFPWQYLPSGQQYVTTGSDAPGLDSGNERWGPDPYLARMGLQRHMLQVGYADHLVGRLLARLRETGLYDRSLVVLTADHGVSYRPGQPRRGPNSETISDIAGVPLLIKPPGATSGRVDDSMVTTIDVLPTIADALDIELPWGADGIVASAAAEGPPRQVKVGAGGSGQFVAISFDEYVSRRKAGLRRLIRAFGSNDGGEGLYAIGPNSDLLGRRVADLPVAAATAGRVELEGTEVLDRYRPGAALAPSFVGGRIDGVNAHRQIAVAVNGRIRSLAISFDDGDDVRLAALVPPEAFDRGKTTVELFSVDGRGAGRRLARLRSERLEPFRLVEGDDGTALRGPRTEIPVERGRVQGYLDALSLDDKGVRLGGWATDPEAKVPADQILVFAGGRLLVQGRPTLPRPDIVDSFKTPDVLSSGWELRASAAGVELDDLRVFAISGDAASELERYEE